VPNRPPAAITAVHRERYNPALLKMGLSALIVIALRYISEAPDASRWEPSLIKPPRAVVVIAEAPDASRREPSLIPPNPAVLW
jgi:hypothetical protein